MRLERVIAKDSRRATEQVIEQFGADALIISNQKVNGMTEIVVAVDIDAEPLADTPVNRALGTERPALKRGDATLSARLRSERTEPVLTSVPETPADSEPGFETRAPVNFEQTLHHSMARQTEHESGVPARKPDPLPPMASGPSSLVQPSIPAWLSASKTGQTVPTKPAIEMPAADEAIRARELVDMVREELASMRREISLSRQLVLQSATRHLAPEVQPLADALEESGAPLALRSLLLDQISQFNKLPQAVDAIRKILIESIQVSPNRSRPTGLHVITGPSGSGKTTMAFRIASRHAAIRGASSVALISFADQRVGAWTQLQMLAARPGIDCYRVADVSLLGAMLGELSTRELIVIDTSSNAFKSELSAIADCAPTARFHLTLPADASVSSIRRFNAPRAWKWDSLMLSKLDESTQPWPVIQSLCNQEFSLSVAGDDAAPESPLREIEAAELVDGALAGFQQAGAIAAPEPVRPRRASTRKPAKDLRNVA